MRQRARVVCVVGGSGLVALLLAMTTPDCQRPRVSRASTLAHGIAERRRSTLAPKAHNGAASHRQIGGAGPSTSTTTTTAPGLHRTRYDPRRQRRPRRLQPRRPLRSTHHDGADDDNFFATTRPHNALCQRTTSLPPSLRRPSDSELPRRCERCHHVVRERDPSCSTCMWRPVAATDGVGRLVLSRSRAHPECAPYGIGVARRLDRDQLRA